MSSRQHRVKRARTHETEDVPAPTQLPGRNQLLLKSPELQSRLDKRYCDESELLSLLLSHGLLNQQKGGKWTCSTRSVPTRKEILIASPKMQSQLGTKQCDENELLPLLLLHGLVDRVRTIEAAVHPLGGDNFKIRLDSAEPTVGEAKAEIARVQGTEEARQELYRVAVRADGGAVREDDAEAEPLDEDGMLLVDGEVVAMAVKEMPLVWRTFAKGHVVLSEKGAVATQISYEWSLTMTGVELTEGRHYWEVKVLSEEVGNLFIGISRPNLDPTEYYCKQDCTDSWFMHIFNGSLYGNGKYCNDGVGCFEQGDRVGVLLDLDDGSLRFFKNGAQHGPGYGAGSVTGPVVAAVQLLSVGHSVQLLPNAQQPQ
jgi:hypothetical protein